MKIRNGFMSNSSSCSFILKRFPKEYTSENVYEFFGIDRSLENAEDFVLEILHANRTSELQDRGYLRLRKKDFLKVRGYQFDKDYGLDITDEIFDDTNEKRRDNYFEIIVEDTYLPGPGKSFRGKYITKNGLEINNH